MLPLFHPTGLAEEERGQPARSNEGQKARRKTERREKGRGNLDT